MPSGADNVLTIHTTDGTERFRIDSSGNVKVGSAATISPDGDLFVTGVCTATTLSGAASGLTGALPAISAANLTNVPAANVVGVHTSLNVTGSTTTGTAVVGGGVTISESGIEASGIGITCANINGTQIGGRRNLVINGAMQIAQRGTSSTTSADFTTDRFLVQWSGADESPTHAQVDVAAGTTPYTLGLRKALKVTNGNQTSGAGAADYMFIKYTVEAKDTATSGWNFKSASSFITLSFWVKSSVAQNFYGYIEMPDTPEQVYPFETGSLTADTWTKITKSIPGNSNIVVNNDTGEGFKVFFNQFWGTNFTDSSRALDTWASFNSGQRMPDFTSTWYTTNDATFELTGVQLEVGTQATPFEHRNFGEELELCKRYFQVLVDDGNAKSFGNATGYNTSTIHLVTPLRPEMRATPTLDYTTGTDYYGAYQNNTVDYFNDWTLVSNSHTRAVDISAGGGVSITAGTSVLLRTTQSASKIRFSAEF